MKNLLSAILLIALCSGCHKEESKFRKAVFTGYDMTKCACCGGLVLSFDDDSTYSGPFYLTRFTDGISLPSDAEFPLKVYVEYQPDTLFYCGGSNRIIITRFAKR